MTNTFDFNEKFKKKVLFHSTFNPNAEKDFEPSSMSLNFFMVETNKLERLSAASLLSLV